MPAEVDISHDYPNPVDHVWNALTDPKLVALWSMRPEGYAPVVGTRFRLVWKPSRMWRGYLDCEVLEVVPQQRLRYLWDADGRDRPMTATFTVTPRPEGARINLTLTGFKGRLGTLFGKRVFAPGLGRELKDGLPKVLADLDQHGQLRPDSQLKPLV